MDTKKAKKRSNISGNNENRVIYEHFDLFFEMSIFPSNSLFSNVLTSMSHPGIQKMIY